MPKFKIIVSDDRGKPWTEEYDKDVADPHKWALNTIANFNASLRSGERPRTVVDVIILGESENYEHTWEKSNLVTIVKGGRMYDTARCTRCGVTGKRYSLSGTVTLDPKFKAAKYAQCISEKRT